MKIENLDKANELANGIQETEKAIASISDWTNDNHEKDPRGSEYDDASYYSIALCQFKDGSGRKVDLSGYHDNSQILSSILEVLIKRLDKYKKLFEELD